MKKSLLALFLCLVMCFGMVAASCGDSSGDDTTTEGDVPRYTITLHTVTNDSTTEQQAKVVEDAINNITHSKFNTNIVLKLYKESEYDAAISGMIDAIHKKQEEAEAREESIAQAEKEARARGETFVPETESTPEEELVPGSSDSIYPAAKEGQLDIFLVRSLDQYADLIANGDIMPLDAQISGSSKLLSSYVYPTLMRAAKANKDNTNQVYGIFNNTVLGDYEYLLLNKELVDKYEFDPEEIYDVSTIKEFLLEVKENEEGVIPFLGEFTLPVEFFGGKEPNILGVFMGDYVTRYLSTNSSSLSMVPRVKEYGDMELRNLLTTSAFVEWAANYNELYQAGCIVGETEENAESDFAARIIKGDVTLSPTYASTYGNYKTDEYGFKYITYEDGKDYYVSIYKRPVADNDAVFGAGYVISSTVQENLGASKEETAVARCMEIITALNTDTELSNILQYGVKDVHYTVDDKTGMLHKIDDSYSMDIRYTGNIYLKYRCDDMSDYWLFMSENSWENAKNTNKESVYSPLLGFINPAGEEALDEDGNPRTIAIDLSYDECIAELQRVSPEMFKSVLEYEDTEEMDFRNHLVEVRNESTKLKALEAFTNQYGKYYLRYNRWYQDHYEVKIGLG